MFNRPNIPIHDFDYILPDDKIAFVPAANRSDSKLLVWDKSILGEDQYSNIANYIPSSSLLIFNNSKVIAARILFEKKTEGTKEDQTNSIIELFCLEPTPTYCPVLLAMQATQKVQWICLVGGAKKWKTTFLEKYIQHNGEQIILKAERISQLDGKFIIEFSWNHPTITFSEILNLIGQIPLPPYIQRKADAMDKDRYQTTYAVEEGSVAAPTAGLHFSKSVFDSIAKKNIETAFVTLHVGAGTFMPVKSVTIDEHVMHAEFIEVDMTTIQALLTSTKNIIAVGTTSLRTLESLYWLGIKLQVNKNILPNELHLTQWEAYDNAGSVTNKNDAIKSIADWMHKHKLTRLITHTQLMITPGYKFRICNGLVTNFHQPKSTLLLIIAAITGNDWKGIYTHALANEYRFLSYGDGCLLWIKQ